jgi:hypothetical protein
MRIELGTGADSNTKFIPTTAITLMSSPRAEKKSYMASSAATPLSATRGPHCHSALPFCAHVGILHMDENGVRESGVVANSYRPPVPPSSSARPSAPAAVGGAVSSAPPCIFSIETYYGNIQRGIVWHHPVYFYT